MQLVNDSFTKIFTKICSGVSVLAPTHHPPPTTSWLRQCLLSGRTVWCPQASSSVWLKHLSFLSRSIFKPFIFVDDVKLVPKAQSPCFGDNDPAKKEPRFLEKPDRRHELYKAHEWARAVIESDQVSLAPSLWKGRGLQKGRQGSSYGTHPFPPHQLAFFQKSRYPRPFLEGCC